jgi:hypothetical protein
LVRLAYFLLLNSKRNEHNFNTLFEKYKNLTEVKFEMKWSEASPLGWVRENSLQSHWQGGLGRPVVYIANNELGLTVSVIVGYW